MKEISKGVNLLTAAEVAKLSDEIKEKLTSSTSYSRLKLNGRYRIIGIVRVDKQPATAKSKEIPEWYGYAVENLTTKKVFATSVATLTGTYFVDKKPKRTENTFFETPSDIKTDVIFTVTKVVPVQVNDFDDPLKMVAKDMYEYS